MSDFNAPTLKIEAEAHLRALRIINHFSGDERDLVILAMCSFACAITVREIATLFAETHAPVCGAA